jgi:tetratricopeptide (TPR) repeat protein
MQDALFDACRCVVVAMAAPHQAVESGVHSRAVTLRWAGQGVGLWAFALGAATALLSDRPASAETNAPLPMVGGPGEDADGYPLATVDKRAVLRLLRSRRFDELEAWVVEAQAQFEADSRKEYWVLDAFDAFDNPDPQLKPLLDNWVSAKPESWAALTARGIYLVTTGWRRRGYKWAYETPARNFADMLAVHRAAAPDLVEAISRYPNAISAYRALIQLATANSAPRAVKRVMLNEAIARCPDCFQVRVTYMMALRPRWGGSYARMDAFAEESSRASSNPKMRLLAGYADWDRCDLAYQDDELQTALRDCNQAVQVGEHWEFLYRRSDVLWQLDRDAETLADLDRAVTLRPQDRRLLRDRARVLKRGRQYERFSADVAVLREIDPVEGLEAEDMALAARWSAHRASKSSRPAPKRH